MPSCEADLSEMRDLSFATTLAMACGVTKQGTWVSIGDWHVLRCEAAR